MLRGMQDMSDTAVSLEEAEAARSGFREQFLLPLKRFPFSLYPTVMIGVFFLIPFAIMFVVSFATRTQSTFEPGFELTHYARFFSPLFTTHLWVSVQFSILASLLSVMAAVPFTYFISRFRRRPQVIALVFLLCVLTLSEVIVAYSISVVMSRSSGLPSFMEWLGLIERARSWYPGYLANLFGLSFFNIPFAVLILYPACTRLDRELTEAAQTMGASPFRSFTTVVLPLLDRTILAAFILLFVFTMGAFVTPTWLGRPEDTMMAQLISSQALSRGNIPFAAALSMFFMAVTLILSLVIVRVRRGDQTQRTP